MVGFSSRATATPPWLRPVDQLLTNRFGSAKTSGIDEGFSEINRVAVHLLPKMDSFGVKSLRRWQFRRGGQRPTKRDGFRRTRLGRSRGRHTPHGSRRAIRFARLDGEHDGASKSGVEVMKRAPTIISRRAKKREESRFTADMSAGEGSSMTILASVGTKLGTYTN